MITNYTMYIYCYLSVIVVAAAAAIVFVVGVVTMMMIQCTIIRNSEGFVKCLYANNMYLFYLFNFIYTLKSFMRQAIQ